ncbi:UvrD-helicase domain-containing protein [Christiangramia flava]|uniref:DNA 3'-5' helicase n=1 Tax=Christiangramia flava JLT2011 TaxID=1229726 RepID=A0A1L7I3K9_9FLAO|nr:UvrD-helicase domain-containing protein [Christiangramia flava]APU68209.1 ATP-dependent helicase [Christiangramia flava JLT2011]OSS41004.1 ATP-dependent helicase [Christiangramia flava JLT2011]
MKNSFTIYDASAGSGKTFTLVKKYLSILLRSKRADTYRNVLAITFTNKAVAEMKRRIIENLSAFTSERTNLANNDMMKILAEETGLFENEIRQKSAEILKSIIHNYAAFEVSTIDGFTHRVLRTFARDLEIPMNFEVELNADDILSEAVDSLINRAGNDEELTKILIEYTLSKTDDDRSWDISRDLFQIARLLTNENNQKAIAILRDKSVEDFKKFRKRLSEEIKKGDQQLQDIGTQFFQLLERNGVDQKSFSRGSVPGYFQKLVNGDKNINFETRWAQHIDSDTLYTKTTPEDQKAQIDARQAEIAELFGHSKKVFFHIQFLEEVQKNIVQLSLLNEINREVEQIKADRNILLISEFNPKISQQVKDQPAPFIYERLGERYRHYFIDEFQDTSVMQWQNLIPLIDHNLSSTEENSSLTLVGDAKQSIYRWRGGKAEQFIELCGEQNPFPVEKEKIQLPDNFRSGSTIVNFNNEFFSFAADSLSFPAYAELFRRGSQQPKKGDYGYVNLRFLENSTKEEELENYPEEVLKIIQELDEAKFQRGDVCILTRTRREGVAVAEFLSENGIPVVSSETLLLSQSSEVLFIIALLKLSLQPENEEIRLEVLDYLMQQKFPESYTYEKLLDSLKHEVSHLFDWLREEQVDFQLEKIQRLSLYEACEYIIRSFELVTESDAHLQFFLDFVYESSQKNLGGIHHFLENWEKNKDRLSIVVPEADDAVKIMTIHKSKGLEFPVVIYPFANSKMQDTRKDNLWIDLEDEDIPVAYVSASKKMMDWNLSASEAYQELLHQNELDTLNVFYVACTRAAERLYILSNKNDKPSGTVADLLFDFAGNQLSANKNEFQIGTAEPAKTQKSEISSSVTARTFYTSSVQNEAVKIVTRAGAMWDSSQQEAIEKGEILHEILAFIHTSEDLEAAMIKAIAIGLISEDAKAEIQQQIEKIIHHPELRLFFSGEMKNINERDIIDSNGERLRPDRLNIDGKTVHIIDYKTGGFTDMHENQLRKYSEVLENMGYTIGERLLIYTHNPIRIEKV